jgi:Fic family protein
MADRTLTQRIVHLATEWEGRQPLASDDERRLWKKLRLEWNYNSNHIEGNTLTYGETELLFKYNQTRGGHDLREYEEMKAHDVAITRVQDLARDGRPLTESEIRTWNEIILKEPFWKSAVTPEGHPTRKQIVPGRYKTQPNSVLTPSGEIFAFADPIDVPAKMAALVEKTNGLLAQSVEKLADGLAEIHHEFVVIHPFDDGNGRVARLIVNFLLLRRKLVPLVVLSEEKIRYITALQQADDGSLEALADYVGEKMITGLNLGLKAARGENVEDLSDVEKRVLLMERQMKAVGTQDAPEKNAQNLRMVQAQLEALFSRLEEKSQIFERVFRLRKIKLDNRETPSWKEGLGTLFKYGDSGKELPDSLNFAIDLIGYLGKSKAPFDASIYLNVYLEQFQYRIVDVPHSLVKSYSEGLHADEIDDFVRDLLADVVSVIDRKSSE